MTGLLNQDGQSMARRIRWRSAGTLGLGCVLLVYALLTMQRNAHKLLWFDELSTLNVVAQPTLAGMLRATPPDGQPPLPDLLIRPLVDVFGISASALRFPSMCGMALAIVCVYVFVARRFRGAAAVVGAALLTFSSAADFGVDARPYALLLGLTALMLVLWQEATSSAKRAGALAGLAATIFALTITHPFGIIWAAVPLVAGEAARWWRTRRLDTGMLAAMLIGSIGFAITMYIGALTHKALAGPAGGIHPAVSTPSAAKLVEALRWNGSLLVLELLLPLGVAAWLVWRRRSSQGEKAERKAGAPLHEWVAVVALILTAFAVYLVSAAGTHYFWPRYLLPSALGCFLLLAMLCGAINTRWVAAAVLTAGVAVILHDRMHHGNAVPVQAFLYSEGELLGRGDAKEPIVVENAVLYPQQWWYSAPAMRARLHYVADVQQAIPTGDFMGDVILIAMHNAGTKMFPVDTLPGFLGQNKKFLLWQGRTHNGSWLSDYLRKQHYELAVVARDDSGETLWEVSAPASAP